MAIPEFQDMMLPLLEICADKQPHTGKEVIETLATKFALTDNERKKRLPSGRQHVFNNRAAWAQVHLKMAQLLEPIDKKTFRITQRGLHTLQQSLSHLDVNYLRQFPEYREKQSGKKRITQEGTTVQRLPEHDMTPEEILEEAYQDIRAQITSELLHAVKTNSPAFFEQLVIDLLVKMGYGGTLEDAGQAIGRSGDEGIDGIIKEDRLGFDQIYMQAKRWENPVGRPEIQKFVGALHGKHARKGVFITTSTFSNGARDYVKHLDAKVVLIDGELLAELMLDYGLGVTKEQVYEIYRVDTDYFIENE